LVEFNPDQPGFRLASEQNYFGNPSCGITFRCPDLQSDGCAIFKRTASDEGATVRIHHSGLAEFGKLLVVVETGKQDRNL
jgi:hypothetical protein